MPSPHVNLQERVSFPCPKCSSEITATRGDLQATETMYCTQCGRPVACKDVIAQRAMTEVVDLARGIVKGVKRKVNQQLGRVL
jgi:hypothetical protein